MPQDPNLSGQRPAKQHKKDITLSSSLDFTAQMTALMAESSSRALTDHPRLRRADAKGANDGLSGRKIKRDKKAVLPSKGTTKLSFKEQQVSEPESRELERSRRTMEEKARLYSAMKYGYHVPKDSELVDFDRKWADAHRGQDLDFLSSSECDEDEIDGGDEVLIEYEDEFGRTRHGTLLDKDRMERRLRRSRQGAEELESMSARPAAPHNIIYGDVIQTMAFTPQDPDKMEELARKRDRSPTPPERKHYDADSEMRDKGVGFYKFSKDEEERTREMNTLQAERLATERARKLQEDAKVSRRKEIERRRKELEARRAKKMADSFLHDLVVDMTADAHSP